MKIELTLDQYEELLKNLQSIRALETVGKLPTNKIDTLIKRLKNHLVLQLSGHPEQMRSASLVGSFSR